MTGRRIEKVLFIAIIAIVLMFVVERFLQPNYLIKSILKLILFGGTILLYLYNNKSFNQFINIKNFKYKKTSIALAMFTYLGIIIGYFLISDFINAKQITDSLLSKENITAQNFIYVAAYISLINSFLEEAFFRGLLFLDIKNDYNRKMIHSISAVLFALYHIGIMTSWFQPIIFVLLIFLLYIAGVVLNILTEQNNTFIASWLIHIAANLAINTIGFMLL